MKNDHTRKNVLNMKLTIPENLKARLKELFPDADHDTIEKLLADLFKAGQNCEAFLGPRMTELFFLAYLDNMKDYHENEQGNERI